MIDPKREMDQKETDRWQTGYWNPDENKLRYLYLELKGFV